MKVSVFVVDDHYMVIEGIRALLQNEKNIEWMGHATNAASCLNFLKMHKPDVILMDISLPDMNGTQLCHEVIAMYPSVLVLGLSTFNQQTIIRKMMENGASGYILKNATKDEILNAIQVVMGGKTYISIEASFSLKDTKEDRPIITRRENEVLLLIAEGLTNVEIAQKLFISVPTVNSHRKSLLEKFDAKNVASMIKLAVNLGFI